MKPNKNRRYRLNNAEVRKLGLEFNLRNRYRLSKEQEVELLKLREPQHQIKRLFFDIETSPNICYAWRIGYNLSLQPHDIIEERKIICISYKWENEDKIHSLTWDKNQCDKQMLIDFVNVANTADELIALVHSLDPAYATAGAGFMFNNTTAAELRLLKQGSGNYLWQDSVNNGIAGAFGSTLFGYPVC